MTEHHYNPYDRLAPVYDTMARALLLPFGGERRFRQRVVDTLGCRSGDQVLELGCGTGSMTRLLLASGARVTALELAEPMLVRARAKAPGARFLAQDVLSYAPEERYSHALLAFVLHEMDAATRQGALTTAWRCLAPGGRLAILDFAGDAPFPIDPVFRAYLRIAEPEMAAAVLAGALAEELREAGFLLTERRSLALGTAQVLIGTRGPAPSPAR